MSWYRLEFTRGEKIKFISHLDLMRVFERAARRGRIPVGFSEGFNPRARMVFGLPLAVGVIALKDYADFDIDGDISPSEIVIAFNKVLPQDLRIIDAKERMNGINIMKAIKRADYTICLKEKSADLAADADVFLGMKEIIIIKEKEGKKKRQDIKPFIYRMEARGDQELFIQVHAGNENNLRPDVLLQALSDLSGRKYLPDKILRTELYTDYGDEIVTPLDDRSVS